MILYINQKAFIIKDLVDVKNIDTSSLNDNEQKAIAFLKIWYGNGIFTFKSSGSTGDPKQFEFSKKNLKWSASQTINHLGIAEKPLHFFICLDINMVAGAMLLARAILVKAKVTIVNPSSNPFEFIPHRHPYTFTSLVPMQMQKILSSKNGENILNKFEHILLGGAPIQAQLSAQIKSLTSTVWATYGMTETLSHIALRNIKTENQFVLLPDNKISLDANNCLRIKNRITKNKWLKTNDIAKIDELGFSVLGRIDLVINSGGYKVNALTVEEQIAKYILASDIPPFNHFVFGLTDRLLGEMVVLCIEKKGAHQFNFTALQLWLNNHVHPFEIPKTLVVVPEFYYTESLKLDRIKTEMRAKRYL